MEAKPALRYPLKKLTDSDDYLKIDILEYKPPGLGNQPSSFALNTSDQTYANVGVKDILDTIFLPIPDNLQDSNSVSWGSDSLNPIQAAMGGLGSAVVQNAFTGNTKNLVDKVLKGASNIGEFAKTGLGQDVIASGAAGFAAKSLLGADNVSSFIRRQTGVVANQNLELLFSGIAIRPEFSFAYDLVPRSKEEGQEIKKIIRLFKYHSSAKKGSATFGPGAGLFLKSPNVFKITYKSGNRDHPFLNRFKVCALLGMSVDYAASGTYATYPDATPTHMRMSLTFKELTPIYAEDYESGIGRDGVGY
jgi:hypothetical protein